jgi:hypothetical protein
MARWQSAEKCVHDWLNGSQQLANSIKHNRIGRRRCAGEKVRR